MDGMNRVILFGNLGADVELHFTHGGNAVLNLRIATTETYFDRDKERQERTEWHNVVCFGKRAEALSKLLRKGMLLLVEGRLQTSSYEDREGNKRSRTDVIAQNIILSGRGPVREAGGSGGSRAPRPSTQELGVDDTAQVPGDVSFVSSAPNSRGL